MEIKLFSILLTTTLVSSVQSQFANQKGAFDVIPGNLVFSGSDIHQNPSIQQIHHTLSSPIESAFRQPSSIEKSKRRHYLKGNSRRGDFAENESDTERKRQGSNCFGVCSYIPDRDFCPTDIPSQKEDDFEDDYSSEDNSIESSEEYYDDVGRNEPQLSGKTDMAKNSSAQATNFVNGYNASLHVVYPLLTRFAVGRGQNAGKGGNEAHEAEPNKKRNNVPKRRRQRRRRRYPVKLRQSALEQEILIRWDRVVERGPYIGGDIVLPEGVFLRPPNFGYRRNRWPDGEIPFVLDPRLNNCRKNAILAAMDEIEDKTCIRFVERENDRNYIYIRHATFGCASYVGMIGGVQHLNLSTGCFSKFTVTHELIHAIGFDHEQSRKDRDLYIDIDFDNVLRHKEGQFELNPSFTGSGFPYDIRSIMHYSAFLFAKDKCEPTIYPVNEKVNLCHLGIGNGRGSMTNCDAAKINKMYQCGRKYPKKCKV